MLIHDAGRPKTGSVVGIPLTAISPPFGSMHSILVGSTVPRAISDPRSLMT
jgi:hypothetical protein